MVPNRQYAIKKRHRLRNVGIIIIVVSFISFMTLILIGRSLMVPSSHLGTAIVPAGESFEFSYSVYGIGHEIGYQFEVEVGPAVDIYMLTISDYNRYKASLPPQDRESQWFQNVRYVSESPYPKEGQYWAVIDNTDYGLARPDGLNATVRYRVNAGGIPGYNYLVDTMIFLMLGMIFFIGLIITIGGIVLGQPTPRPPAYCSFCGSPSGMWVCPNCKKISPPLLP